MERIRPSRYQPRQRINPDSLGELADSIRVHGLLQPLLVSYDPDADLYELVAGERRLEAAKLAGLQQVPAISIEVDDETRLELGLIENVQREDLNPIEEALAYRLLMQKFALSQEQVARKTGKKRTTISNTLRLLNLPKDIQDEIAGGNLSAGHAKALVAIEDPDELRRALEQVLSGFFSVRQTEELVRQAKEAAGEGGKKRKSRSGRRSRETDPNLLYLEELLRDRLGAQVRINAKRQGGGTVEIEYYDQSDLERIAELIGAELD